MQIFSPYPNCGDIANCLDPKRLNKQKVEIYQILNCIALGDKAKGWKNHPAVKMARGNEPFFIYYGLIIADKCIGMGWKDTLKPKIYKFFEIFGNNVKPPVYWGMEQFHLSHQSNLIRKFPEHYQKLWPGVPNDLPYFWPVG